MFKVSNHLFLWMKTSLTYLMLVDIPQLLTLSGNCPCMEKAKLPRSGTLLGPAIIRWLVQMKVSRLSPLTPTEHNSEGPSQLQSLHYNSHSASSVSSPSLAQILLSWALPNKLPACQSFWVCFPGYSTCNIHFKISNIYTHMHNLF